MIPCVSSPWDILETVERREAERVKMMSKLPHAVGLGDDQHGREGVGVRVAGQDRDLDGRGLGERARRGHVVDLGAVSTWSGAAATSPVTSSRPPAFPACDVWEQL